MSGNDLFESMMSDLLTANDRVTQAKLKALEERNKQLESKVGSSGGYDNVGEGYEVMLGEEGLAGYEVMPGEEEDDEQGGFVQYEEPDELELNRVADAANDPDEFEDE